MRSVAFLVPGRLETRTGGYVYDRRIVEGLRQHGWSVAVHALDETFPYPSAGALRHAAALLAAIPKDTCVLVDGLAAGAMPDILEDETARLRIAALVHLPLAADVTLEPEVAVRLAVGERRALNAASLVVVTGTATLTMLGDYGLPSEKIVVVEPGTHRVPFTPRADRTRLSLLTVGTVHAGKGHLSLVTALAGLKHRPWELTCAGSVTRDAMTAARVREVVQRFELDERVRLVGELDEEALGHCYDRADVFVLATLQETYGMAVAEAMAHGLPVIATRTGAIPQLVGTDAGLLVPPGDEAALTRALDRVLGDAPLRARLAEGAWRAAARLPTWAEASRRMSDALAMLDAHG